VGRQAASTSIENPAEFLTAESGTGLGALVFSTGPDVLVCPPGRPGKPVDLLGTRARVVELLDHATRLADLGGHRRPCDDRGHRRPRVQWRRGPYDPGRQAVPTRVRDAQAAVELLEQARVLGVVLTQRSATPQQVAR